MWEYIEFFLRKEDDKYKRDMFIEFNQNNKSRSYRFSIYVATQRVRASILNKLKDYNVYWGDWNINKTKCARGNRSSNIELQDYLKRNGVNITRVDEYKTSKLCHCCYEPLDSFTYPTTEKIKINPQDQIKYKNIFEFKQSCSKITVKNKRKPKKRKPADRDQNTKDIRTRNVLICNNNCRIINGLFFLFFF